MIQYYLKTAFRSLKNNKAHGLVLVFVAMLIARPIAWWVMQEWLAGYAHRIDMAWWIILLGGTLGIGIALLSVGFQALRAARSNPVDALRDE